MTRRNAPEPTSAQEVLADLYEEVTGDQMKNRSVEWMAARVLISDHPKKRVVLELLEDFEYDSILLDAMKEIPDEPLIINFDWGRDQPVWVIAEVSEDRRLLVDITGRYTPELEVVLEAEDGDFEIYTVLLERYKPVGGKYTDDYGVVHLIDYDYDETWPHAMHEYSPWWEDTDYLTDDFIRLIQSSNPRHLVEAYEYILGRWGVYEFDQQPQHLTPFEFEARWETPPGHMTDGYRPCACRDCMEMAIGYPGAICQDCKEAGCTPDSECKVEED